MKRALVWVIAPLALGVVAYVTLRAPELRLHEWLGVRGEPPLRGHVPAAIAGSLPDAAWAFAFGAALALVWGRHRAWALTGAIAVASVELAQAARLIEGVYDPIDLAAMLVAYAAAWRYAGGRSSASTTAATVARARVVSSGPSVTPPTTA